MIDFSSGQIIGWQIFIFYLHFYQLQTQILYFIKSGSFWWCSYYSLQVSNVVTKHSLFDLTCLLFTTLCRALLWWIGVFCPMFCFSECFPATLLPILRWKEIKILSGSYGFCSCFKKLFLLTHTYYWRWCSQTQLPLWSCSNAY